MKTGCADPAIEHQVGRMQRVTISHPSLPAVKRMDIVDGIVMMVRYLYEILVFFYSISLIQFMLLLHGQQPHLRSRWLQLLLLHQCLLAQEDLGLMASAALSIP